MKYTTCRTQCVLALLVLYVGLAHSWDVAVSAGDELRFYTNNIITSTRFKSQTLSALAYDELHNMMLYVDKQTDNDKICGYDLSSMEIKCFIERKGRNIHGITFDPATDTVFFTDTNEKSVNWISLKPGSVNNPNGNLLIKMDDGVPRDIVVDSCKGYIYWLNTNLAKPTIERARLDGTEREIFKNIRKLPFNTTHNLEPHSLAFDRQRQAIYWIEPVSTRNYYLYSSQLNTKNETTVIMHFKTSHYPLFLHPTNTLTVSKDVFFAVDFRDKVGNVYKFSIISDIAANIKTVFHVHHDKNIGIIANYKIADQIKGLDCEALEKRITISPKYDGPFCVHGMKDNERSVCKCTPGYTGERCDVSVCENSYCLNGKCSFNDEGLPVCSCNSGYSGNRCEVYACHGYCLNEGNCSLNEEHKPVCQCVGSYEGTRCETDTKFSCHGYCQNKGNCSLNEEHKPVCQCVGSYEGTRCETDTKLSCHGYCQNKGNCSLNKEHKPVCQCVGNYEGTRCEAVKKI